MKHDKNIYEEKNILMSKLYSIIKRLIDEAKQVGFSEHEAWEIFLQVIKHPDVFKRIVGYYREHLAQALLEREGFEMLHHKGAPYDYLAMKNGKKYLIEVKSSKHCSLKKLHIDYYLAKWVEGYEVLFVFVKEKAICPLEELLLQALARHMIEYDAKLLVHALKVCRETKRIPVDVYRKIPSELKGYLGKFVE